MVYETVKRATPPAPASVSPEAARFLEADQPTPVHPELSDTSAWLEYREIADATLLTRFARRPFPVVAIEADIAGVTTYIVRAEETSQDDSTPVYLDIHGGALVVGGGAVCRAMASGGAMLSGMTHWAPDYRMPPIYPYPAALDDCLTVYRHLLDTRPAREIVVGGASAGGNLAAALVARARDEGLPVPAGLVLLSPEVDLTESGDSFVTNLGIDSVLTRSLMHFNLLYANGHPLTDPYLSPLFADVSGFPPTFLQSGTRDLFLSNTVRMHRKLRSAGVDAELHVFEAMPHGGFAGAPEDLDVRMELRRWLDRLW